MADILPFRQRDPFSYSDEDMLKIMSEDWNRSEDHYNQQFDDMEADWKRILLISDTDESITEGEQGTYAPQESGQSTLKGTALYEHFNTFISMVMKALFPKDSDWLFAKPTTTFTNEDDVATQLNNLEAYRQYRLWQLGPERMNFYDKFEAFIRQGVGFYWSFLLYNWETRGRFEKAPIPDVKQGLIASLKRKITRKKKPRGRPDPDDGWVWNPRYYENTGMSVLNTFNTRPDPRGGRDLRDCAFLMDEYREDWYRLYENEYDHKDNPHGQYFNLNKLEELYARDDGTETEEEKRRKNLGEQPVDPISNPQHDEKERSFRDTVVLRRYWTQYGVIVADSKFKVIIQKRRYSKLPMHACRYSMDWTKFESQSLTRVLRDLDDEVDFLTNYELNNAAIGVDGIPVVDVTRINDASMGQPFVHGRTVLIDGPIKDAADIISTRGTNQQLWQIRQYIRSQEMPGVSGVTENMMGRMFSTRRLATEISAAQSGGASRGGQWVDCVQDNILTPLMNDLNELEATKLVRDYQDFIVEGDGSDSAMVAKFPITKEFVRDMAGICRFVAQGSRFMHQEDIAKNGFLNYRNTCVQHPLAMQVLNLPELMAYGATLHLECPDPTQFMNPEFGAKEKISPEHEWELMQRGHNLEPNLMDDDMEHIEIHKMQYERAMVDLQIGRIEVSDLERLEQHLAKTQSRIAQKQQAMAAPAGPVNQTTPGQENSQNTPGAQMANANNPEPKGVGAPTNAEVM